MRFQSYLNTAGALIGQYDGSIPLVHFLKRYFSDHKKHGSKDRKFITHLCYCYYRTGHSLKELPVEEKLRVALFLCNHAVGEWASLYDDGWLLYAEQGLTEKIAFIQSQYPSFSVGDIFPWQEALSDGIDPQAFALSHLVQPDLFLRIRPGMGKTVLQKLTARQIPFVQLTESCLALPNASKIDTVLDIDREVVVQDRSSQGIAGFFPPQIPNTKPPISLWDCCAASGGKSILAYDHLPKLLLTVSDIRPSIIQNLKKRFEKAGIQNYKAQLYDVAADTFKIQHSKFNIIICDAPCTGSGTWARTPEQLYFFSEEKTRSYAALQKKIVGNVMPYLENGGYLLYITCSVFKQENEAVAQMIGEKGLPLVKTGLLKGYDSKADTMFAALFQKSG